MNRASNAIEKFTPTGAASVAASGFNTTVAFAIKTVPEPSMALTLFTGITLVLAGSRLCRC